MHVQHPDAEACRRRAGLRYGVRDVVKLQIEKHFEPALDHAPDRVWARGDEKLLPYLERASPGIQTIDELERARFLGEVQRDDDPQLRQSHRESRYAGANTFPICRSPGSASSTAWRESRIARSDTCRGA